MPSLTIAFFHDLRNQLTNPNRKIATWGEVAQHCKEMNFDVFTNKDHKAVARRINDFKTKGIPYKVQLQFQFSKFCQNEK